MTKGLIIVESPAKARTIQKYLGGDYLVLASKGHIRDLPKSGLQVDVAKRYEPHYEVLEDHKSIVSELKKAAKGVEVVYLAPDPDREGEAIAWHIAHELRSAKRPLVRVEFHEITRKGVQLGLAQPRDVDERRFNAQQARRILDRLIGYELSPVLWKRLCRRVNGHYLSAGRVQSAALRLIVDREDEIRAFSSQEFWPVSATLVGSQRPAFATSLVEVAGQKVVTPPRDRALRTNERVVGTGSEAQAIAADLRSARYLVTSVDRRERKRRAPPPYITSSLQRDAAARLGFSASRTMQVAQRLYEGIDVGAEGPVGLITYMRTDSTRMSSEAVDAVRDYVARRFGAAFVPEKPNFFKTKSNAQDAHEAVRPTSVDHHPDSIHKFLKPDEYKVYKMIWERFVACQMAEAVYDQTSVAIEAQGSQAYGLRATGQVLKFAGWLDAQDSRESAEVAGEESVKDETAREAAGEDAAEPATLLPELAAGEALSVVDPPGVVTEQKFTQPSARYNEGTLVKALEDLGIGRPSTYAEIVTKVLSRDYVERKDRQLVPTRLGMTKTHALRLRFPDVVDYEFTARIEEELDKIEVGGGDWVKLVDRIYKPFHREVEAEMKAREPGEGWPRPEPSDRICEKCGSKMVRRWGPTSDFFACTAYPACKNIVDENPAPPPQVYPDRKCPKCGKVLYVRVARRGSKGEFLGCSGWPECDYTSPMPTGIRCPKCGGDVIKVGAGKGRRAFYGCSNFRIKDEAKSGCDFRLFQVPVAEPCPLCGAGFLVHAGGKTRPVLRCVKEDCGYERAVPSDGEPEGDGPEDELALPASATGRPGAKRRSKPGGEATA